jgi:uncharacterized membrane protein
VSLPTQQKKFPRDTTEFDRSLNFVDAIFGFSVTLLVTTLDVPPAEAWRSLGDLLGSGLGDQLLAVAISFAVITGFWRTNHRTISTFRALDPVTLRILIYLVALVIFLPFTTKAISDPDPANLPLPTALYAANVAAVTLISVLLVLVGRWRGLTDPDLPLAEQISGGLVVAVVFLASIPVAYRFGPGNAKWCWLSLVVIAPLADVMVRRLSAIRRRSAPASPPR